MPKKAPLEVVEETHGSKEKLVDKLVGLLDRGGESKDAFRNRLLAAANSKLLRLHTTMTEIKERFGNTEKLVDALLELMNRTKDADYRSKLLSYTPVKLLSLYQARQRNPQPRRRRKKRRRAA